MSLNKVLEHTMSPEKMILKIRKLLKLNGIFYLEVPDQLSATKGKEREELMVEHLHVFSKMSLKNLMVRNKFKILQLKQIKEPSGKYTIFGFPRAQLVNKYDQKSDEFSYRFRNDVFSILGQF